MMADNTDHRQKRKGSNYNRKNKSTLSSQQKALLVFKHLNQVEQSQFPLSVITEKFSSGALAGKLSTLWLRIRTSSTDAELKQYYVDVVENSKTPMPHLKEECHYLLSEHSIDSGENNLKHCHGNGERLAVVAGKVFTGRKFQTACKDMGYRNCDSSVPQRSAITQPPNRGDQPFAATIFRNASENSCRNSPNNKSALHSRDRRPTLPRYKTPARRTPMVKKWEAVRHQAEWDAASSIMPQLPPSPVDDWDTELQEEEKEKCDLLSSLHTGNLWSTAMVVEKLGALDTLQNMARHENIGYRGWLEESDRKSRTGYELADIEEYSTEVKSIHSEQFNSPLQRIPSQEFTETQTKISSQYFIPDDSPVRSASPQQLNDSGMKRIPSQEFYTGDLDTNRSVYSVLSGQEIEANEESSLSRIPSQEFDTLESDMNLFGNKIAGIQNKQACGTIDLNALSSIDPNDIIGQPSRQRNFTNKNTSGITDSVMYIPPPPRVKDISHVPPSLAGDVVYVPSPPGATEVSTYEPPPPEVTEISTYVPSPPEVKEVSTYVLQTPRHIEVLTYVPPPQEVTEVSIYVPPSVRVAEVSTYVPPPPEVTEVSTHVPQSPRVTEVSTYVRPPPQFFNSSCSNKNLQVAEQQQNDAARRNSDKLRDTFSRSKPKVSPAFYHQSKQSNTGEKSTYRPPSPSKKDMNSSYKLPSPIKNNVNSYFENTKLTLQESVRQKLGKDVKQNAYTELADYVKLAQSTSVNSCKDFNSSSRCQRGTVSSISDKLMEESHQAPSEKQKVKVLDKHSTVSQATVDDLMNNIDFKPAVKKNLLINDGITEYSQRKINSDDHPVEGDDGTKKTADFESRVWDSEASDIVQPPPNPTQINRDNDQGFMPNLTKNSGVPRIVWDDMSECSIGQFFTNRVYLDQNYNRPWIPSHLGPNQHTKMLAFDEVVALNDLQMAVLVNSTWMMDCLYYVVKFPKQVDLTVICPRGGSSDVNYHDSRIPAEHRSLIVCEQHIDSIMANDQGVIQNTSCCLGDCSGVRNVKLIHSHDSNNINANFYLLRYSDKLRVVVYTGPLARTHWERVIHFGWFYDFPIKHIEDTDTTQLLHTSGNRFSQDLHLLLDQLDYKESDGRGNLLKTVQFAGLSQYVQLITAAPSRHMMEADCRYGLPQLTRLLQVIHWQNVHSCQKLCQSWKMGTGNGVSLLQSLFNLRQPVRRKSSVVSSLQLLYPSKTYMRKCMENFPDLQEEVNHMFSNNDRYNLAGPYLRDICFQKPVISRANLLLMYERISASCTKISETKSESVAEVKSAAETDKKYGKFGFLFTGSQTLGYGSWGGQKGTPGSYHFARYELGVGLFPYFNQHTQEQHALDLTEIGLHLDMDHIQQYGNTCVPYTPWHEWSPKKNIFYRSLVIINHKKKGELVFADGFSANHPFMTHTDYEPLPESCNSALMKPSRQSNQRLPSCTSVLDVILFKGDKGMWGDSSGIINTFKDKYATAVHFGLEEVYKTYQEEFSSVKKYPVTESWSGNPIQILKPKTEEKFHEKMQELGLKSDEEIENYMQKFQLNILAFQKQILPHLDENASNPDCRSTFINTDINWLEEHVRQTCFDKFPRKMIGPYNIDILQQQVKGHRKCVVISDMS